MLAFLSNNSTTIVTDPLEQEIKKYFAIEVAEVESIDWWQQHKDVSLYF